MPFLKGCFGSLLRYRWFRRSSQARAARKEHSARHLSAANLACHCRLHYAISQNYNCRTTFVVQHFMLVKSRNNRTSLTRVDASGLIAAFRRR
jgi:hypothetical protein